MECVVSAIKSQVVRIAPAAANTYQEEKKRKIANFLKLPVKERLVAGTETEDDISYLNYKLSPLYGIWKNKDSRSRI